MPAPKARTRHTQYTTEAFREIAEAALEELVENSGTLDSHDLVSWTQELKKMIGHVSDHQTSSDPAPFGRIGEGFEEL